MPPTVSKEKEKAIRDAVVAFVASTLPGYHVFGRRRFISSRKDFARVLGKIQLDQATEIVFAEVEFVRFVDDEQRGWDDCPSIRLFYSIHLFRQFCDVRLNDDGDEVSNSTDEFVAELFDLRDAFLATRTFAEGQSEPLRMPENAQFGRDELIDATGHAADLEVEVVFNRTT
jgi:hypothetical protein